jgi:hypothetical protein
MRKRFIISTNDIEIQERILLASIYADRYEVVRGVGHFFIGPAIVAAVDLEHLLVGDSGMEMAETIPELESSAQHSSERLIGAYRGAWVGSALTRIVMIVILAGLLMGVRVSAQTSGWTYVTPLTGHITVRGCAIPEYYIRTHNGIVITAPRLDLVPEWCGPPLPVPTKVERKRIDTRLQDMICMAGSRGDRECKQAETRKSK